MAGLPDVLMIGCLSALAGRDLVSELSYGPVFGCYSDDQIFSDRTKFQRFSRSGPIQTANNSYRATGC
jgi:hypothetical protein